MTPTRSIYKTPWYPPPFRETPASAHRVPARGTGSSGGGPPDLIGNVVVMIPPTGRVAEGDTVRFVAVRYGGSAPTSYEWSGPDGPIAGETSPTLTITATFASSGTYIVTVTSPDATDSPVTASASITVTAVTFRIRTEADGFILTESNDLILQEH
jgi:plastocyanin